MEHTIWEICDRTKRSEFNSQHTNCRLFVLSDEIPSSPSIAKAYICCLTKDGCCVIFYVYVAVDQRRQGYGKMLVTQAPLLTQHIPPKKKGIYKVNKSNRDLKCAISVSFPLNLSESASYLSFFCGGCKLRPVEFHPEECSVTLETTSSSLQRVRTSFIDSLPRFKSVPLKVCTLLLMATLTEESPEYSPIQSVSDKGLFLWRKDVQDLIIVQDEKRYWEQRRSAIIRFCRLLLAGRFPSLLKFDFLPNDKSCELLKPDKAHLLSTIVGIVRGDTNEELTAALETESGVVSKGIVDLIKIGAKDLTSLYN